MTKNKQQSMAQMLLLEYRPTIWRKAALKAVLGTSDMVLQTCIERLRYTQELVESLRGSKYVGDKLYWIIYASYMTEQQPKDVEEILADIALRYKYISRRTYFRLKGRAISMMNGLLNKRHKYFN